MPEKDKTQEQETCRNQQVPAQKTRNIHRLLQADKTSGINQPEAQPPPKI